MLPSSGPPSVPPAAEGRFISLGTKLAAVVVAALLLVSLGVADQLSRSARSSLIDSKRSAADMVVDLFAASVGPALDFDDQDFLRQELAHLKSNPQILYAAVWGKEGDKPISEIGESPGAVAASRPPPGRATQVDATQIRLVRTVSSPTGESIGSATVVFTLAPENAEYATTRRRIVMFSLGLAAALAALVILVARLQVARPLDRLVAATRRVRQGHSAKVEVTSRDEIGRLGEAFNVMAAAILDRERRLAAAHRRIQDLLSAMRQGIVVFGRGGALERVQSRQAEAIFGEIDWSGGNIVDLLYPGRDTDVEARAFREWVEAAFEVPLSDWNEVAALAPTGTLLHPGTDRERVLSFDFVAVPEGEAVPRVMLLVTDETEKRRLEQTVRAQEEQHARQMSAMRRLVAGGGQLLVGVLDGARERLATCRNILDGSAIVPADVDLMFRAVHTIKGEARSFDLGELEASAEVLEDLLEQQRHRSRRGAGAVEAADRAELLARLQDLDLATGHAEELLVEASPIGRAILDQVTVRRSDLARLTDVVGPRQDDLGRIVQRLASRPFGEAVLYLVDAVPNWAEREGKRTQLVIEGRDAPVPPALARVLPAVLTHLARNAVTHGIERVELREASGKPAVGLIRLAAAESHGTLEIVVEDDGGGLDEAAIRRRAAELGLDPAGQPEAALVFADGLSTATSGTALGGRGVGLSAARADLLAVGYEVDLTSSPGAGTRIVIRPRRGSASASSREPT
jgi:HPt (histidine-containing phosphotransfer) domain-containing protein/HAMP domain-containing protein